MGSWAGCAAQEPVRRANLRPGSIYNKEYQDCVKEMQSFNMPDSDLPRKDLMTDQGVVELSRSSVKEMYKNQYLGKKGKSPTPWPPLSWFTANADFWLGAPA